MHPIRRVAVRNGKPRGFTYLWVLLMVALLGMGLALGAEVYRTSLQREQESALLAIGHEFRAAIRSYYQVPVAKGAVTAFARYPTSLEDLLRDPRSVSVTRHLRQIYVDPLTGRAEWGLIKVGDRIVGIHSLADRSALKQGNFEPQDLLFEGRAKVSEWWFTYPADVHVAQAETRAAR